MKEKEINNHIINHMDYRFDQIEKLITLSLINDILPQNADGLCENLSDEIKMIIEDNDYVIVKTEIFSDKLVIYLRTERKVGIKELRELKKMFALYGENIIIVFELDKATAIQKRKFVEEKISYYIKGKELFISKD